MLKRLLALSRSTHGLLDIAMPGFVALLWLGHFPTWQVLTVSLVTVLAGYTAVYALNDLLGMASDKEKFAIETGNQGYGVESSGLKHPLAQGTLSLTSGVIWFAFWFIVALVGSYWLNPPIIFIVLAAGALETTYCFLLKVTWWRVLVSGLVKSAGPMAAVFVVIPEPPSSHLWLMLAWLVLWEIGGQNIPADWNDVEEDRHVGAKTIPQVFGTRIAAMLIVLTLLATVVLSLFLPLISPLSLGYTYQALSLLAGGYFLLWPAFSLRNMHNNRQAAKLFDRASLYPLAQLVIILGFVLFASLVK